MPLDAAYDFCFAPLQLSSQLCSSRMAMHAFWNALHVHCWFDSSRTARRSLECTIVLTNRARMGGGKVEARPHAGWI